MYPAAFEYRVASSVGDVVRMLSEAQAENREIKILAGGQSLLPMLKLRLVRPALLVDLRHVVGLSGIGDENGGLRVGAMTTHATLEDDTLVRQRFPGLTDAAAQIGDRQVRNRGTIGGSLAHADPTADWAAAAIAYDATMRIEGANGMRDVSAVDFLIDSYETTLGPTEIVTSVYFPAPLEPTVGAYLKLRNPASGYALAGAAVRLSVVDGCARQVRVGLTGVGPIAYRARFMEAALEGERPTPQRIASASMLAGEGVSPLEDTYASAEYRLHLATVVARRAVEHALARAGKGAALD